MKRRPTMHLRAFILAVGFAAIPLFAQQPPPPELSQPGEIDAMIAWLKQHLLAPAR